MTAVAVTAWCRACGSRTREGDSWCSRCGTGLDAPDPGLPRVGKVVSVKGRMLRRNGIALRESDAAVAVLVKGDETVEMPLPEFDSASTVDVPGPLVGGAAGRLWRAFQAQAAGTLQAKWDPGTVHAAAVAHAVSSLGTRRAAALDAIAIGFPQALPSLGLSEPETSWYQARAAAAAGATPAAVGWLERLPSDTYAVRVPLLLTRVFDLLRDAELGARAAALIEAFTESDLDARALAAALAAPGAADVIGPLVTFAAAAEGADGQLAAWAMAITKPERPAVAFPDGVPTVSALDAYLASRTGAETGAGVGILRLIPMTLLDEMIDRGVIPPKLAGQPGWPVGNVAYLRCRLTPGEATEAELRSAGFNAELARRSYLAGDAGGLDALPGEDAAVRHYRALAGWRAGSGTEGLAGLRPEAGETLRQLARIRAAVKAGETPEITDRIAADPTCWPLLWDSALHGGLGLPARLAEQHPRFADWLELCQIQRMVFESHWPAVVDAGQALANRTALEITSDEALNMVAYAQFRQGRAATALRTLEDALSGRYTTGLLVNASIVAAAQGPAAAIAYLERVTVSEQDQAVCSGAYQRAAALWLCDSASQEYPEELRRMVRAALSLPQPDDFHRTLLMLADHRDTEWLASADTIVRSEGSEQEGAERYRRAWARAKTEGFDESVADVAKVLCALAQPSHRPVWVRAELRKFVNDLSEVVHTDFGEAFYTVPVIEALLAGGALEPVPQIMFAAQAGAHLAVYLSENGSCVTPQDEQRLLFDTVRRYRELRPDLTEGGREYLELELARCVSAAARAVAQYAARQWDEGTNTWNRLVERQRFADANLYAINRMKTEVLDNLEPWVKRLQGYLSWMKDLPLEEPGRNLKSTMTEMAGEWSSEIRRLRQVTLR